MRRHEVGLSSRDVKQLNPLPRKWRGGGGMAAMRRIEVIISATPGQSVKITPDASRRPSPRGPDMKPIVAIIAPGSMGSGIGRRLVEHGIEVRTWLEGRSRDSAERARSAGMVAVAEPQIAEADLVLSIVPPGAAIAMAERLAPVLRAAARPPVYIDCNAVSPETVRRIAAIIAGAQCPFVDAGIIGGPPRPNATGPTLYASGEAAPRLAQLARYGLEVSVIDGPIGAASTLKMSYAGITKGLTAIGAAMMLAATRAGAAEALHRELGQSQPALLAWLTRQMPGMYAKAYRWVAEMEEIAAFAGEDAAARQIFEGAARFYDAIAADVGSSKAKVEALTAFVTPSA